MSCFYCSAVLTDKRQRVCKATDCRSLHRSRLYFQRTGRVREEFSRCRDCGVDLKFLKAFRCLDCRKALARRVARERKRAKRPPLIGRVCEHCGTAMPTSRRVDARFCNRSCLEKFRHQSGIRAEYHHLTQTRKSARNREWRRRNPISTANHRHTRRSKERSGRITTRDWNRALNRTNGCCYYCGERAPLTMEHVVPLSRGGLHTIGNVVPACGPCNYTKSSRFVIEWRSRKAVAA